MSAPAQPATRVMVVSGAPGVGKTTVGRELIEWCPPGASALLDTDHVVGVQPWRVDDRLCRLGGENITACLRGFRRWGARVIVVTGVVVPEGYLAHLHEILHDPEFSWSFYGLACGAETRSARIRADPGLQDAEQRQGWAHLQESVRAIPGCHVIDTDAMTAREVALGIARDEGLAAPARDAAVRQATIAASDAARLTAAALVRVGTPHETANRVARHLVRAELDGYPSHGLLRLGDYVGDARSGALDPTAMPETHAISELVSIVQSRRAYGVLVGDAVRAALRNVTAESAVGVVAVRDAHHLGRIGALVAPLAADGLLVLGFANFSGAGQRVPPFRGGEGRLCTNPVVAAIPRAGHRPIVMDVSTSTVAEGKVRQAMLAGEPVPVGWLVAHDWRPVTDPSLLYTDPPQAMLTPLGGFEAGHKGWALGLMVEVLAGVVGGGGFSGPTAAVGGNSALFIGLVPERIRGADRELVDREVEALVTHCLSSPAGEAQRPPRVPGVRITPDSADLAGEVRVPSSVLALIGGDAFP